MSAPTDIITTDNFYKFICTIGLMMLLFAIIYPVEKKQELELSLIELERKVDMVNHRVKNESSNILNYRSKVMASNLSVKSKLLKIDSLKEANKIDLHKIQLDSIDVAFDKKKLLVLESHLDEFKCWSMLLVILGIPLAAFGGIKWYMKDSK